MKKRVQNASSKKGRGGRRPNTGGARAGSGASLPENENATKSGAHGSTVRVWISELRLSILQALEKRDACLGVVITPDEVSVALRRDARKAESILAVLDELQRRAELKGVDENTLANIERRELDTIRCLTRIRSVMAHLAVDHELLAQQKQEATQLGDRALRARVIEQLLSDDESRELLRQKLGGAK